jgi:hypothetical protein
MKHIKEYEEFINESVMNETVDGLLPKEDYPLYIAVRSIKVGDDYMAAAVLPEGDNPKYHPMSYVLEELRKHYKMSKGEFPSNKSVFDRYRVKNMNVTGTSMRLDWGPQNRGYQIINIYSPDKKELEDITELIAKFAKK